MQRVEWLNSLIGGIWAPFSNALEGKEQPTSPQATSALFQ
jgi:hypothetical protein